MFKRGFTIRFPGTEFILRIVTMIIQVCTKLWYDSLHCCVSLAPRILLRREWWSRVTHGSDGGRERSAIGMMSLWESRSASGRGRWIGRWRGGSHELFLYFWKFESVETNDYSSPTTAAFAVLILEGRRWSADFSLTGSQVSCDIINGAKFGFSP